MYNAISINLLPSEIRRSFKTKVKTHFILTLEITILIIIAGISINLLRFKNELLTINKNLNKELTTIESTANELNFVKNELNNLKLKKKNIIQAKKELPYLINTLNIASQSLSEKMWLKEIVKSKEKLIMLGFALNNEALNNFIIILKRKRIWRNFNITYAKEISLNNIALKEFQLEMIYNY